MRTGNAPRWRQVQDEATQDTRLVRHIPLLDGSRGLPHWHELGWFRVSMEIRTRAGSTLRGIRYSGRILFLGSILWTGIPAYPHAIVQEHSVRCECCLR
jgi:hypothetical protein